MLPEKSLSSRGVTFYARADYAEEAKERKRVSEREHRAAVKAAARLEEAA